MLRQDDSIQAGNVVGDAAPAGGMMAAAANLFARAGATSRRADPFVLGDRAALLHHLDQAALIPRVAESEGRRFPIEVGSSPVPAQLPLPPPYLSFHPYACAAIDAAPAGKLSCCSLGMSTGGQQSSQPWKFVGHCRA